MRALTVRRPWANLIAARVKRVENRSWLPHASLIGERIAIHSGAGWDPRALANYPEHVTHERDEYAQGIVAVARIGCVVEAVPGGPLKMVVGRPSALKRAGKEHVTSFYVGPFGWVLIGIRALPKPIPCKGALGLWTLPDSIEARINEQINRGHSGRTNK